MGHDFYKFPQEAGFIKNEAYVAVLRDALTGRLRAMVPVSYKTYFIVIGL
jgi:hypothetical protein